MKNTSKKKFNELKIPIRIQTAIIGNFPSVIYLEDLTEITPKEFLQCHNIGKSSLKTLKIILASHGLFLKNDIP